jgi:hypothetical protein
MCSTKCTEPGEDLLSLLKQVLPRDTPIHVASSSYTTNNTIHQKDFITTPYSSTINSTEIPNVSYPNTFSPSVNLTFTEKPCNYLSSGHDKGFQFYTTPSKCVENLNGSFQCQSTKETDENDYKKNVPNLLATLNDFCAEKNLDSTNHFAHSLPYFMSTNEETFSNSFAKHNTPVMERHIYEPTSNNNLLKQLKPTTSKKLSNNSTIPHNTPSNLNSHSYQLNEIFLSNSNLSKHGMNSSVAHNDIKLFESNEISNFDFPYKKSINSVFPFQTSSYLPDSGLKLYSRNPSHTKSIDEFFANTYWEYIDPQGQIQVKH